MANKLIAIAATDKAWHVGYKGNLLVNNSYDLKRFSDLTSHHIVVMGRKTFESLPGNTALPNRTNVVLSRNKAFNPEGVLILHSMRELEEYISSIHDRKIWIIGGQDVWEETLHMVDECLITYHHILAPQADTSFPNIDEMDDWTITSIEGRLETDEGIEFEYRTYRRCR